MTIGYHASHEQFPPATLLGLALRALCVASLK